MKIGTDAVLLGAWASTADSTLGEATHLRSILDVGTGSGVIALMMAQRFQHAQITAVEIDEDACREADNNFRASCWSSRLNVCQTDFRTFQPEDVDSTFDLIVSNPPFFVTGYGADAPDMARRDARQDSTLPLSALIKRSADMLSPDGSLCLVLPAEREKELKFQATLYKLNLRRICYVSTVPTKPPRRILTCLSPVSGPLSEEKFSIHTSDSDYTPEYIGLVNDFYLNM